jgi:hypothetical protein
MFFGPAANQHCVKNPLSHNPGTGTFPEFNLQHTENPGDFIP